MKASAKTLSILVSAKGDAFHAVLHRDAAGAIQYIKRAAQLPNLRILQSGVAFKTEGTFKRDGA